LNDKVDEVKETYREIKRNHPHGLKVHFKSILANTNEQYTDAMINWLTKESIDMLFMGRDDKSHESESREIGVFTSKMLQSCTCIDFFIVSNSLSNDDIESEESEEEISEVGDNKENVVINDAQEKDDEE